ncbi:MAG: sulfatase [Elusimicrobia bacterium]|nr:sulfatase [Elusimicrobiota bacterium]
MKPARRTVALLCFACLPGPASAARGPQTPYNIVIVDICSARADRFGAYGYSKPTTPQIDALAKESVVFERAMAQSSWCLPNYASLFTGHTPEVHGQYVNAPLRGLPGFETTLAQRMKEAGYDTASFSGGVYMMKAWGLDKGFDHYENLFSTAAAMPASMDAALPRVERWVKRDRKGPFFLYMAVDDLHTPYQSAEPERFDPGYDGIAHDTDVAHVRFFRAYNGEALADGDPLLPKLELFRRDPRHLAHLSAHYDASLRHADAKIAELVARLKAAGRWERTVLIVTADHGELLGEHGLMGHTEGLYEPVLRVPLILRHPGFPELRGRRISKPVQRIDLTPTVLDIAGASYAGAELQGASLLPLLRDPGGPWRAYAYASSKRNMSRTTDLSIDERVLQNERWKLHWYAYKDRYELYDLERDPLETRDVSADNPDVLGAMSFELLKRVEQSRPHAPGLPSGRAPGESSRLELPSRRR